MSDVTEVDGLATFAEEQQPVEDLEELCGRLVDGAQDGLAVVREAA